MSNDFVNYFNINSKRCLLYVGMVIPNVNVIGLGLMCGLWNTMPVSLFRRLEIKKIKRWQFIFLFF